MYDTAQLVDSGYRSGVQQDREVSLFQSYFSNDSIHQSKIIDTAALTGRTAVHPSSLQTPMYHQPGYIGPKINKGQMLKESTTTTTMISNPNDLMHTFSLSQMLKSWNGIYVKQKTELMEAITGCETGNKYLVYERGGNGRRKGKEMLECKEFSSCCARNCTTSGCRPFKMRVFNLWNHDDKCLEMDRDCQLTVCCLFRPSMQIYHTEGGSREYLGRVVDNFDCCNYSFDIQDHSNRTIFYIEGSCCQCGLWCKCPCQGCEKVTFNIWRGKKQRALGTPLVKHGKRSCVKNAFTDADDFSVPFPGGSTFEERCLLLGATLFIDYMMFESSPSNRETTGPSAAR